MQRPDSVIVVPGTLDSVFKAWLVFLKPFHNLTDREMDVAAAFLKLRYDLSNKITDEGILDEITMNEDSKRKIREMCGITNSHFQVVLGKLKKSGFLKNNVVNPRYIPSIREDSEYFQVLFCFKLR